MDNSLRLTLASPTVTPTSSVPMYLGVSGFEPNDSPGDSRKEGEDEGIDETEELAQIAGGLPRSERLAVLPVPESEALLARHTSEVDNQTKEDQAREREDLDEAEPELDLASAAVHVKADPESGWLTSPNHLMPRQLTAMTWSQYGLNQSSTQQPHSEEEHARKQQRW